MAKTSGIQARGHTIEICGGETGHVTMPVAYCDTPNRAFLLVKRWKSHDALLEALKCLVAHALPTMEMEIEAASAEELEAWQMAQDAIAETKAT